MGCIVSTPKDSGGNRRRPGSIGDVSVYVPGLRIPKPVDFTQSLGDSLSKSIVERLSALRTRIVVMAGQEGPTITRTKRKSATQHGGSTLADLLQALEDYLPVLLGLVKDESHLQYKVQFVWMNQEDEAEETAMPNAWYEVLSVLHLMATLLLSQANLLLLPRTSTDGHQPKVSEENRRASVDIFLKAGGYLDCAVRHVLPQLPAELRRNLPVDLAEGVLRALCLQALGQGVDIQLGMAIDSTKATLAVKRRLACEMVKYWQQAQDNIMNLPLANGWGEKHRHYVKWKYIESKATAYYYHGLILDTTVNNAWRPNPSTDVLPVGSQIQLYRYELFAPGGIWVAVTLMGRYQHLNQAEITFVAGIQSQYIRSVQIYTATRRGPGFPTMTRERRLLMNGHFRPHMDLHFTIHTPITFYIDDNGAQRFLPEETYPPHERRVEKREVSSQDNEEVELHGYGAVENIPIYINAAFRAYANNEVYLFMNNE